jgi:hypothetical protein
METELKKRPGRPKVGEGGRQGQFVGFRCPDALKEKLEKAATTAGRSLSTETQFRIEKSFNTDQTLGAAQQLAQNLAFGPKGAELLRLITRVIRHAPGAIGMDVEDDWFSDATAFHVLEREITHLLHRLRPEGTPREIGGESPENRVDRLLVALKLIEPPEEWAEESRQ